MKDLHIDFGKQRKATFTHIWKKRSIFCVLPYWFKLDVQHYINLLHVAKNMYDSLIGTLLNIKGKTKDDINSRLDMIEMNIRDKLTPKGVGN